MRIKISKINQNQQKVAHIDEKQETELFNLFALKILSSKND